MKRSIFHIWWCPVVILFFGIPGARLWASSLDRYFLAGTNAYQMGDYAKAARDFRKSASLQPSSGTLQNLGNTEWQRNNAGSAILAWEQALWINPYYRAASQNLQFARKAAQLDTPDLSWYEVISTWLPVNVWPWITGGSLWIAVGIVLLPGIFGARKAAWHQAVAALSLTVFLLSVPAHFGIYKRSHLGFILFPDTPLRLTPTVQSQVTARLSSGEPARGERNHGRYLLIQTNRSKGWIEQEQLGLICPRTGRL
jgi:tetratricopeptide (TPR) repeat protein